MTYFVYDGVTGPTPLANLKAGELSIRWTCFSDLHGAPSGDIRHCDHDRRHVPDPDGRHRPSDPGILIVSFVVFIVLFGWARP